MLNKKLIAIRSYFIPVTEFSGVQMKQSIVLGYARALQEGETFSKEVIKINNDYVKCQKEELFDLAIIERPLLKLMLDEKMFKPEDVPSLIEKVTETGNKAAAAMLLDYLETKFS